jgi:hypothetical protein
MPPILPDFAGTSATSIDVPIFSAVDMVIYPYTNISSASSANNIKMEILDENNNILPTSATQLSNTTSLVYAIADSIISKLINDHKLITNTNITTSAFNWFLQTSSVSVPFDPDLNYPSYYQISATVLVSAITGYHLENEVINAKVSGNSGYLQLEKYVPITIDPTITDAANILGCNIIAYDGSKYNNIQDFYINGRDLWIKLKTDYVNLATAIPYDLKIEYFYRS